MGKRGKGRRNSGLAAGLDQSHSSGRKSGKTPPARVYLRKQERDAVRDLPELTGGCRMRLWEMIGEVWWSTCNSLYNSRPRGDTWLLHPCGCFPALWELVFRSFASIAAGHWCSISEWQPVDLLLCRRPCGPCCCDRASAEVGLLRGVRRQTGIRMSSRYDLHNAVVEGWWPTDDLGWRRSVSGWALGSSPALHSALPLREPPITLMLEHLTLCNRNMLRRHW